uniref:hypothetical protein n=1 Tax=Candidatus Limisoma sp. TaxID=3076476 RepID=UPI0040260D59
MKKILSILSMLAVCLLMASCQTDADKACAEMAKNMKDGKVDAVAKTAAELYSQKDDLSIDNLSDLAIAFHYLAQKESSSVRNDATYLSDYIEKSLDCYMAVYSDDADKAVKIFKEKNQAQLGNDLTRMKKQLKQLQDAEQALIDQINS